MEDVMCLALTSSTWQARTRSLLSLGEIANWLTREQLYITPESWDDLGEDDDTDGWYEDHKELYENAKGCGRNLKKVLAPLGAIGMELEALRMMTLPMENGVHGRHVYPCFHTKRSLFFLSYHQTAVHYAGPIGRYSSLDRHMSSGAGTTYLMDAKSASLMGARVAKLGLAHEDVYAIFKTCSYYDLGYHVDDDDFHPENEDEEDEDKDGVLLNVVTAWASNVDLLAAGWLATDVAKMLRDMIDMLGPYYTHFMVEVVTPILDAASKFMKDGMNHAIDKFSRLVEEAEDDHTPASEGTKREFKALMRNNKRMEEAVKEVIDFVVEAKKKEHAQREKVTADISHAIEECEASRNTVEHAAAKKRLSMHIKRAEELPWPVDGDLLRRAKRAKRLVKLRRSARLANL